MSPRIGPKIIGKTGTKLCTDNYEVDLKSLINHSCKNGYFTIGELPNGMTFNNDILTIGKSPIDGDTTLSTTVKYTDTNGIESDLVMVSIYVENNKTFKPVKPVRRNI